MTRSAPRSSSNPHAESGCPNTDQHVTNTVTGMRMLVSKPQLIMDKFTSIAKSLFGSIPESVHRLNGTLCYHEDCSRSRSPLSDSFPRHGRQMSSDRPEA
jgi:hypothetical protein